MPIRPDDKEHIARALGDTGVFARDLLGYNYDEVAGGQRINVGTGGIRDSGKTREIIQLLDDAGIRYKLVMVPRDCRKSTMAQALCLRRISENPNIRIFYVGRTDDIVRGKSLAIRAQLLRPEIETLFGPQQGDKWEEMEWTVAGRNMPGLMNATFTAFSQDSLPTGGRCDLLILDDFIDHTNVATPEQNKKSKERWKLLVPFISSGSEVIIFCTLWADDDLNSELRANRLFQPPTGGQVVCGAGVRVVHDGLGGLDLEITEGGLTFPHLTLEYLREKLHLMALAGDYRQFVRQYLNETASLGGTGFYRQDFQPLKWENDMESLSGYLLTDTAIGKSDDSCFSVLAYVGLDQADHIYLLDLEIGHWDPTMFRNKFFDMLEAWKGKVNHCGECWEKVQLATAYRDAIEQDSRARKLKLHTIDAAPREEPQDGPHQAPPAPDAEQEVLGRRHDLEDLHRQRGRACALEPDRLLRRPVAEVLAVRGAGRRDHPRVEQEGHPRHAGDDPRVDERSPRRQALLHLQGDAAESPRRVIDAAAPRRLPSTRIRSTGKRGLVREDPA